MKKLISIILLAMAILLVVPVSSAFAAVGQELPTPETGWQRIDDSDPTLTYNGTWSTYQEPSNYNGSYHFTTQINATMSFEFYGTQIRIIAQPYTNRSSNVEISIDGVAYPFSENGPSKYQAVMFEKSNLDLKQHSVKIRSTDTNNTVIDAIDIFAPQASERAVLTITLENGIEKEFDLSIAEVNSFISWYEGKAAGAGTASYAIDKHDNNKGPFTSRKDYVIFNKILMFEVNAYTVTQP